MIVSWKDCDLLSLSRVSERNLNSSSIRLYERARIRLAFSDVSKIKGDSNQAEMMELEIDPRRPIKAIYQVTRKALGVYVCMTMT